MTTCPHSRDICDNRWTTEGQPCCAACTHINGTATEDHDDTPPELVKINRDLTEILDLNVKLLTQAVRHGDNPSMPGGEAMAALANVADLETWENLNETTERLADTHTPYTSAVDEDPEDAWGAYQLVKFWAEEWRREHGQFQTRPTLLTEVAFIRACLPWAWDNEPRWDQFRRDINRARVNLENVLTAGNREERTRVPCNREGCERHPMLIKVYAAGDEHDDRWKCPCCRHRFDIEEFNDAYAAQARQESAKRYVTLNDAIWLLRGFGVTEATVRTWLKVEEIHEADICPGCDASFAPSDRDRQCPDCGTPLEPITRVKDPEDVVEAYCELGSRRRLVWWPDIWTRHLVRDAKRTA